MDRTTAVDSTSYAVTSTTTDTPSAAHFADELRGFDFALLPAGDWKSWTTAMVCSRLTPRTLALLRRYFWSETGASGLPKIFYHASLKQEAIVYFACSIANSARCFLVRDQLEQTLLHYVAAHSSPELVEVVLAHNRLAADCSDVFGETPYHIAADKKRASVLRVLCGEHSNTMSPVLGGNVWYRPPVHPLPGSRINELNSAGMCALHLAVENAFDPRSRECLNVLRESGGADLSIRRLGDGATALHMAVLNEDDECATALLNLGARSSWRDGSGESVLQMCGGGSHRVPPMNAAHFYHLCAQYTEKSLLDLHAAEVRDRLLWEEGCVLNQCDAMMCGLSDV